MKSPHRFWPLPVLSLLVVAASPLRADKGGADAYGYTFTDSTERDGPRYQWIDISSTGQTVIKSGKDVSSNHPTDGIGSPVELGFPLTLYGNTVTELVPCSNGYLSTDPTETGADNKNVCPLPAPPTAGRGDRLYVLHDFFDLNTNGTVYYEYFCSSPHPHDEGGVSVFSWVDVYEPDSDDIVSFQALLFDNGDIVFQYAQNDAGSTDGASIAVQNAAATIGLSYLCTTEGLNFPDNLAVLFRPPVLIVDTEADENHTPAGADLSLREAVRDIPDGGRIEFAAGVATITLGLELSLDDKAIAIDGAKSGSSSKRVTLSGGGTNRILRMENQSALVLHDLVLIRGTSAIRATGNPNLACRGVDFYDHSPDGACVLFGSSSSKWRFVRCRFGFNHSSSTSIIGGAISTSHGSELSIKECSFFCNTAVANGSAIATSATNFLEKIEVSRSVFFDNETFLTSFNTAQLNATAQISVTHSTFSHNRGSAFQLLNSGTSTVAHCTFVGNTGDTIVDRGVGSAVSIDHCVFQGNSGDLVHLAINSQGYNLADTSDSELDHLTDVTNTDPLLGPLGPHGGFTFCHLPLAGSPLIDGGDQTPAASVGPVDQRGLPRIADGDGIGFPFLDIGAVEAQTLRVVNTAIDENNGAGFGAGTSLREAVGVVGSHGHVRFAPALSGQTITLNPSNGPISISNRHIDASNLNAPVTIDGGVSTRCFTAAGNADEDALSLHHLRVLLGRGNPGGGLLATGGATLDRCDFELCGAGDDGGGIDLQGGGLSLDGCHFLRCTATLLGGAVRYRGRLARVTRSWFEGNGAFDGGGLHLVGPRILGAATLSGNFAADEGGGLYLGEGHGEFPGISKLQNLTVSGNHANDHGGGIYFFGEQYGTLSHSTVFKNTCNETGGGAGLRFQGNPSLSIELTHNIVAANGQPGTGQLDNAAISGPTQDSLGFNLCDTGEAPFTDGDDLTDTPTLGPLAYYNRALAPVHYPLAPCPSIDAGDSAIEGEPATDALGGPRVADGDASSTDTIDIGAVEAAEPIVVTTRFDQNDNPAGAEVSLREAVRDAPDGGRVLFQGGLADIGSLDLGGEVVIGKSLVLDATNQTAPLRVQTTVPERAFALGSDHDVAMHGISIRNCETPADGGGLAASDVRLTMSNCAVLSNESGNNGGGIFLDGGEALFENVTFGFNTADKNGGAVFGDNSAAAEFRHCTVFRNGSIFGASGIHFSSGSWELFSSIVALNLRGGSSFNHGGGGAITSLGYNLTDTSFLTETTDLNNTDPGLDQLTQLSPGGYSPVFVFEPAFGGLSGSPAVDAGPPGFFAGRPCTDARGLSRIVCGRMDIGAFELGGIFPDGSPGIDDDDDGMDDFWEQAFGLDDNSDDSALDLDGDGLTNLGEFLAQTKPDDPTSVLRFTDITLDPSGYPVITWSAVPQVDYEIWVSEDLGITDPWTFHASAPGPTSLWPSLAELQQTVLIDTNLFDRYFFQVRIAPSSSEPPK